MARNRTVAIIGGSLVGPAAAHYLGLKGIPATVFEALPKPHAQSGGIMSINHRTLGLLNLVGVQPDRIRALGSEVVGSYEITQPGHSSFRGQGVFPGITTSWDRAYTALGVDAPVKFSHRLTGVQAHGRQLSLTFANGTEVEADCVVFADGRKSLGRELLDPGRALRYGGYVVWRGVADPPVGVRPRGFERHYDPRAGRQFNITQPLLSSGQVYWELLHNVTAAEWARITGGHVPTDVAYLFPSRFTEDARRIVLAAADRLSVPFQEMIAGSVPAGIPVNDTTMPDRCVFISSGGAQAVLLGDALIPSRLQSAAGLNSGLLQAYELADVLAEADPVAALRRWEAVVIERQAPLVELGRRRAHGTNLGRYEPVRFGQTAILPNGDIFADPKWVAA